MRGVPTRPDIVVMIKVTGVGVDGGTVGVGVEGDGDAMTPVPVMVTVCTPLPSLPSKSHVDDAGPVVVGANRTVSTIDVSAAMTSFKGLLSAPKPPVAGGVDEIMVSGKPPWSPNSKVIVALEPTSTFPKATELGIVVICAGGAAVPWIANPKAPEPETFSVNTLLNTCTKSPDELGGAKLTSMVHESFA